MRSRFAMQTPTMHDNVSSQMQAIFSNTAYDSPMAWDDCSQQQYVAGFGNAAMQDFGTLDAPSDVDFSNFISVQT